MTEASMANPSPSPAVEVSIDMVKRGALVAPVAVIIGALIWGNDGAASVLLALGLVLANLLLSAWLLAWGARTSPGALVTAVMGGFVLRLGLITVVVLALKDQPWVDLVALGMTIIVTHLGLLVWELRYISGSLAYPGLKPDAGASLKRRSSSTTNRESIPS